MVSRTKKSIIRAIEKMYRNHQIKDVKGTESQG